MIARSTDIVFLLGAGASAEADIPTSESMIEKIELLLQNDDDWTKYLGLYNHVKSAIHYSSGLHGRFGDGVIYNIETLVNTLYELERNEDHPLYPFIASWNFRFAELAGDGFSRVKDFRIKILGQLKKWMCPEDTTMAEYYEGLKRLQRDLNFSLPVFSLNYDTCVERLNDENFTVETGFGGYGPQHGWDWERFEHTGSNPLPEIVLYKLHGSINWKRDTNSQQLFSVEQTETVDAVQMEVIFGKDFKLEVADPYLFYAYQFRRHTIDAALIIVIGYSFGDVHINKILSQGLRAEGGCDLVVVCKCEKEDVDDRRRHISQTLGLTEPDVSSVVVVEGTAREFLRRSDLHRFVLKHMPERDDLPF